ncbi:MAG: HAMP domain-containing histidine kinase [Campylobacterales bacterium]|nr:HAMP domain-containing histidine kinase [Campylobacterales bacterium]
MSVLKNLDINLPHSEKRSLYRFLALYTFFTLVVLALTSWLYYSLQKELAQGAQTIKLNAYTDEFMLELQELQEDTTNTLLYPRDEGFETSLYGSDYKLIYSTLSEPQNDFTEIIYAPNKLIRYVTRPKEYYLHTQYIVVEIMPDETWLDETIQNITLYGSLFFLLMSMLGYFLVRLFLKPMRDALILLDTFIKDTTHELNTPVSTILTNVELIDTKSLEDTKLLKKVERIEIGAKTISNIYEDLTYLILQHKIISSDEEITLSELFKERVEYFTTMAHMKKITFTLALDEQVVLHADRKKMIKIIDNLLSNAIKYNKMGGSITLSLNAQGFSVEDSGRGIAQQNIAEMFTRYARFDKSAGGFGIGLNIVKMICDEYNFTIQIESKLGEFTKVHITF